MRPSLAISTLNQAKVGTKNCEPIHLRMFNIGIAIDAFCWYDTQITNPIMEALK
jgi:hypothetical protein